MLELRRIRAGYGHATVLRDVSLRVPEARVVALLGPNGAGKSTLLRVASGLLAPEAGCVLLHGEDITRHGADRRARAGICYVPEGRGVFPSLTVAENLRIQADRQATIDRALEAFPALAAHRHQAAGTLSGGQQQMLALARLHMARPRLVLVDEASMGLSPRLVDDVFVSLRRLVADGVALLLVEQYVTRALELADYVYLLNKGRVTFVGEPSELDGDELFAHYLGGAV